MAAHPGWAATNLQGNDANLLRRFFFRLGNKLIAQDGEAGALNSLYAAVQDLPGGSFVGPDGMFEMRGAPSLASRSAVASNPAHRPPSVDRFRRADRRHLPGADCGSSILKPGTGQS